MRTAIVDPGMLNMIGEFYNKTCTIMAYVATRNSYGENVRVWMNVTGHENIPCRIASAGGAGSEQKLPMEIYSTSAVSIALKGYYPTIVSQNRAVVDGVNYDILGTQVDGLNVNTVIAAQIVPGSVVS